LDFATIILLSNQTVYGLILLLITPGFAFTCALYPQNKDLPFIARLALSCVLSIALIMLSSLFLDLVIGMDTTALNILITILTITTLFIIIWIIRVLLDKYLVGTRNKSGVLDRIIVKLSAFYQKLKAWILFIVDKYFYK